MEDKEMLDQIRSSVSAAYNPNVHTLVSKAIFPP